MTIEIDFDQVSSFALLLVTIGVIALAVWLVSTLFPGLSSSSISGMDDEHKRRASPSPHPEEVQGSLVKTTNTIEDANRAEVSRREPQK